MIIYSLPYKLDLINHTTFNLVAILINYPEIGLSLPSSSQLELIRNLTMTTVAQKELTNAGGYKRHIVIPTSPVITEDTYSVTATSAFTATTSDFDLATHIVYTRGADLTDANNSNGNNIGSNLGTVILVESIEEAPYRIVSGVTFNHSTVISLA